MEIGSPFEEKEYILSCDAELEPEKQRKLIYTNLTVSQDALLDDIQSEVTEGGYRLNTGKVNLMAIHLGLKKMVNFFDKNGNAVNLERDQTKRAGLPEVGRPWNENALNWIPKYERMCVSERIKAGVNLDEDDSKN